MVDTVRTLAALQALYADNTSQDISPQDGRDFMVSVFPRMTDFTPVFTAASGGFDVGNGTVAGAYAETGDMVYYVGRLVCGSSTNFGTGTVTVSLPVTANLDSNAFRARGEMFCFDSNVSGSYQGQCLPSPGDLDSLVLAALKPSVSDLEQQVSATVPMTWTTSDQLGWSLWYPKRAPA